jgi:hypothetical protein
MLLEEKAKSQGNQNAPSEFSMMPPKPNQLNGK